MTGCSDLSSVWEELVRDGGRIVYLVLDGAGGLRDRTTGKTALEMARTPNLDRIMRQSACGLLELVGPGITPGSGPGHLALFGYDPLHYRLGRGVLSALGIDFDLREGDVAARVNFATVDDAGRITDRRAGRLSSETNRRLCDQLRKAVQLDFDGTWFLETVAEHRAVLVLRGKGVADEIRDTDPQATGVPPRAPQARTDAAQPTAELVRAFVNQAHDVLADEAPANAVLLRGFQRHAPLPSLQERFGLRGLCVAQYPMYRGLSRLLGFEVADAPHSLDASFDLLARRYGEGHDFCFLHVKGTDRCGEDGDFQGKVAVIEDTDRRLSDLLDLQPDVLVVTADHSTPAAMAAHSWHPVPVLIHAASARADGISHFDEYACRGGGLGLRPGLHLMGLALAHAGRLNKFGA
ncbi:MAG: 2,3-bisphosphoglycerate-independent phosphoglycerate mutase [Thiobacillus sp.]